jgi:2'-5' RNA ligase
MAKSVIVVALPAEDDQAAKLSSEKVPHMTLLYLQDQTGDVASQMAEFIEHAAKVAFNHKFFLEVDHRGTLGDKEADVLFFSKARYSGYEAIKTFRHHLLGNEAIRTAYDSTEQFPEWIPHMTLGYPDNPAKKSEHNDPYNVLFDRIAFWVDDYEGPVFRLKNEENDSVEPSMAQPIEFLHSIGVKTDEFLDREHDSFLSQVGLADPHGDFLEHYGIKGMRWGFRRTDAQLSSGAPATSGTPSGKQTKQLSGAALKAHQDKLDRERVVGRGASYEAGRAAQLRSKADSQGLKSLTNKELQELNARNELEAKFSQWKAKQPVSRNEKAREFVMDTLKDVAIARVTGGSPKTQFAKTLILMNQSRKQRAADRETERNTVDVGINRYDRRRDSEYGRGRGQRNRGNVRYRDLNGPGSHTIPNYTRS